MLMILHNDASFYFPCLCSLSVKASEVIKDVLHICVFFTRSIIVESCSVRWELFIRVYTVISCQEVPSWSSTYSFVWWCNWNTLALQLDFFKSL